MTSNWCTRLVAGGIVLASLIVEACSSTRSPTSNSANDYRGNQTHATNSRPSNQDETPATAAECDPNYAECVPIASDVDCAGGRGNGPAYVKGPVRVIGRDIYGLDRDGDGIGCE